MIAPRNLVRYIELGVGAVAEAGIEQAITFDVLDDDGNQLSPSAATVKIYDGSELVQDTVAVTSVGPPVSYTIPAATLANRSPSSQWLELWTLTIDGETYRRQRKGYVVRTLWVDIIQDSDLTDLHSELEGEGKPDGLDDYSKYRLRASGKIQRDLLKMGRRPWLIFEPEALFDAHVALTLHYIFEDWATEFAESRYATLAEKYEEKYAAEMDTTSFSYDSDEDGIADDGEDKLSTQGPLVLTAGNVGQRWAR